MKKALLAIAAVLVVASSFTSCKNKEKCEAYSSSVKNTEAKNNF